MSENTATQVPTFAPGEVNILSCSFDGKLESGELLTGTPTVAEQTTSDLTITNVVVNTVALVINTKTVAIGKAVQCKVIGQLVANSPYLLLFTVGTDASPAQTKKGYGRFMVAEE